MFNRDITSEYNYKMPADSLITDPSNGCNVAANIAFFMLENGKTISDVMYTRMKVADQRKLFGRAIGRGRLKIDSLNECVLNIVKVDFGHDTAINGVLHCKDLSVTH